MKDGSSRRSSRRAGIPKIHYILPIVFTCFLGFKFRIFDKNYRNSEINLQTNDGFTVIYFFIFCIRSYFRQGGLGQDNRTLVKIHRKSVQREEPQK
ncbi:MAG: hypothetical protein AAF496_09075 [Pseudomonadota bacterium]